ncbi:hypothetical protein [Lysobacter panacisoli]|uniref:Uncharacterized protein n=1 Tax=Lysobacter panacisoli TaxID=1255263 RepID=A0ABP9LSU3_9GAMM|nr:hypothetical protein [Lysobacter panacisoli]
MIRKPMLVLLLALPLSATAGQSKVAAPLAPVPNGISPAKPVVAAPAAPVAVAQTPVAPVATTVVSPPIPVVANGSTPAKPAAPAANATIPPPPVQVPVIASGASPTAVVVLPPMKFLASVAQDEVLTALKSDPAFVALDKELAGSPLVLVVTHTVRPTAAGTAAGLLSAMLSGGTLGILPVVTNDRLVVRYEVLLNGKVVTSYTFERTATRAQNIWTAGSDGTEGLGKGGMEWVQSTAREVATKLAHDPAMLAVRDEIEFYFPSTTVKAASTAKP